MSDLNTLGFDPISLPVLPAMKPLAEPSYGSTLLPPLPKPTTPVQAPLLAAAPQLPPPMPSMKPLPPTPPSVKQSPPVEPAKPPVSSSYAWLPEFARSLLKPTRQKGVITTGLVSLAVGAGVLRMVWPPPVPNRAIAEVQVAEPVKAEAPLPPVPITPLIDVKVPEISLGKLDLDVPSPTVTATPTIELPKITIDSPKIDANEKQPQPVWIDPKGLIAQWLPLPMTKDLQQKLSAWIPEMRIPDPDRPTRAPTLTLVSASEPVITVPAPVTSTAPTIPNFDLNVPKVIEVPMLVQTGVTPPAPVAPVLTLPMSPMLITPPVTGSPTLDVPAPKTPIIEVKKPEAKFEVPMPKIEAVPQVLPKIEVAPAVIPKIEVTPALPKIDVNPVLPEPAKLEPFDAKPAVPAVGETRTDYDVDLHYPKGGGETWASVSKQYLGDDRYGEALKAYNRNAILSQVPRVEIPPIHVLRKKYATLIGQPVAASTEKSNIEWAAAPASRPTVGYRQYAIPTGGMTMKEVAKAAYGDENMWGKIWDLNPTQRADEAMRPGTKILLPSDAKIGE